MMKNIFLLVDQVDQYNFCIIYYQFIWEIRIFFLLPITSDLPDLLNIILLYKNKILIVIFIIISLLFFFFLKIFRMFLQVSSFTSIYSFERSSQNFCFFLEDFIIGFVRVFVLILILIFWISIIICKIYCIKFKGQFHYLQCLSCIFCFIFKSFL